MSECLFNLINKESEKRLKNNFYPMPLTEMPAHRFEHPNVKNSITADGDENREVSAAHDTLDDQTPQKRISIMMRAQKE